MARVISARVVDYVHMYKRTWQPELALLGRAVMLLVFETTGALRWLCAVNAGMKYESIMSSAGTAQSFAMTSNGKGYTGRMFNVDLKALLVDYPWVLSIKSVCVLFNRCWCVAGYYFTHHL